MAETFIDKLITQVSVVGVAQATGDQEKLAKGWAGVNKQLVKGAALAGAFIGAAGMLYLRNAAREAMAAERVQVQFNTAMRNNLALTGKAAEGMSRYAESLSAASGASPFGDEEIKGAIARLSNFRDAQGKAFDPAAIRRLVPSIIDAAVGIRTATSENVTLDETVKRVSLALAGQSRGLKQLGINIDQDTLKTRGLAGVQEELDKRFKGSTGSFMKTAEGAAIALQDALDELRESVGGGLLPVLKGMNTMLRPMVNAFTQVNTAMKGIPAVLLGVGAAAIPTIIVLGQLKKAWLEVGGAAMFANAAQSGGRMGGFVGGLGKVEMGLGIGAAGYGIATLIQNSKSPLAEFGASTVQGATLGAMVGSILPGVGTAIGAAIGGGIGAVGGAYRTMKSAAPIKDPQIEESNKHLRKIANAMDSMATVVGGGDRAKTAYNSGDLQRSLYRVLNGQVA